MQKIHRRAEIGEGRRIKTRSRLVEAAARVLAERGSDRVTIDDFIDAAGVSRGTFYNHFRTRQELLDALWTISGRDPFNDIQRVCWALTCPAERFAMVTRMVLMRAIKFPTWGWLIIALSADEATVTDDLLIYPRPDLREGKRTGRFSYESETVATDLVVGTMRTGLRALLQGQRNKNYPETLCCMILLALGVDPAEAKRISLLTLLEMHEIA